MRSWKAWRAAAGPLALALVLAGAPLASAQPAGVTNVDYIFSAHPDDEYQGYGRIDGHTSNYRVFVYMTRGEQGSYCRTASDPALQGYAAYQEGLGPYGYQGPNAAVPQYDRGELDPRFNGLSPWAGRWTGGCVNSRVQSTLRFLDALAVADSGQPATFDQTGRYYGGLSYPASVGPRRYDSDSNSDNPTGIHNYVNVYLASNGRGAAVFFDLGDGDLTRAEARWAIDTTLARGRDWGFPSLANDDAMGNYYNRIYSGCDLYSENQLGGGGGDHGAVHGALWDAMGASTMDGYGRTCKTDPDALSYDDTVYTSRHTAAHAVSGAMRTGTFTRRYGWLTAGSWGVPPEEGSAFSRVQRFWRR